MRLTWTARWPRNADRDPGRVPCSSCPGRSGAKRELPAGRRCASRCGPSESRCRSRSSCRCQTVRTVRPCCCQSDAHVAQSRTSGTRRRTSTRRRRASRWHCLAATCGRTACTPRWESAIRRPRRCCIWKWSEWVSSLVIAKFFACNSWRGIYSEALAINM